MGSLGLGFLRRRSIIRPFSNSLFSSSVLRCPTPANPLELGFVPSFESASIHGGLWLGFTRSFSDSRSEEDSKDRRNTAASIKPVSYPMKPKDDSSSSTTTSPAEESTESPVPTPRRMRGGFQQQEAETGSFQSETRSWTREDVRYVKNAPIIAPVSYPTRVAPLPEDRVLTDEAKGEGEAKMEEKKAVQEDDACRREALEKERRGMERHLRVRSVTRTEEENLPFPTLIKPEKGKTKALMDLPDAIREVKANAKRNFTETVEAHVQLGVDPRRGDQMVRGAITLPHGTGKVVRVAVFAEGAAADEAKAAGADIVGGDELIEQIKNGGGKLNFDKCIAVPSFMPRLGKIARILGPRGLMPNPKLGSLTNDVSAAVQEAKRGRVDFRIDKTAIVHVGLGKVNFSDDSLRENVGAFVNALLLAKPVGLKKTSKYAGYVNKFTLCSTMGPGFPVTVQSLSIAADHYSKLQLK